MLVFLGKLLVNRSKILEGLAIVKERDQDISLIDLFE